MIKTNTNRQYSMVGIFLCKNGGVLMQVLSEIIEIVFLTTKIILMIYSGLKFLSGDKEKNYTLFYGILFVATLV